MPEEFEKKYEDVLQNIEFALVSVYREDEEMTDYQATKALDALIREYKVESGERPKPEPRLQGPALDAYERIQGMCEWRLGREQPFSKEGGRPIHLEMRPLKLEEIIACLKRVKRSVETWNKEGGRRGYFAFVDQFLP